MIKIRAIQTGRVKVKPFQATGAGSNLSRLWQLLLTKKWSDWLPVYCFLVEHPAGPFLIDAGEVGRVHERGYLPDNVVFRSAALYDVKREDEIDRRLAQWGIAAEQIRRVYLTHFHSDHMDGLCRLPDAEAYAAREARDFLLAPQGERLGYLRNHLPAGCRVTAFEFTDGGEGPFECSKTLLEDGSLVAVPLPGHSAGHTGYIVKADGRRYLFSGDAVFDRGMIRAGIPYVILNSTEAVESVRKVREFAAAPDAVVLCSHDPGAAGGLTAR